PLREATGAARRPSTRPPGRLAAPPPPYLVSPRDRRDARGWASCSSLAARRRGPRMIDELTRERPATWPGARPVTGSRAVGIDSILAELAAGAPAADAVEAAPAV